eukprot:CAMPEP_0183723260 /NCGR_PEP_ID=MMETSP0737-20130205/14897_1 /TAXON_ID=385413 /ORGANISM="Thalassiosira miniscula, Strain CCMP1093" /LENGTH=750 /DNA_ID=CAMNT_0025953517 /DNA_START=124 /DNA_END=2373 /DNA_ORIENTATION=-
MRKSDSFPSKFSIYGCIGSLLSVAFTATISHIASLHNEGEFGTLSFTAAALPTWYQNGGGHQWFSENELGHLYSNRLGMGRRRMEGTGKDDDDVDDGSMGMACGDIFLYVKRYQPFMQSTHIQNNGSVTINNGGGNNSNNINNSNNSNHNKNNVYSTETSNFVDNDYNLRLCNYAQTCDGDFPSTTFLPLLLCHGVIENPHNNRQYFLLQSIILYAILPIALLLYLLLLFRLLATTADSYFSPALESFSFELGLPPRFAGATLLALGNGSPDLGSTVNAILLWREGDASNAAASMGSSALGSGGPKNTQQGWTMGIGSLTGGGMFVGTIVCGLLIQSCSGIPCRFAFLRDVSMYALSVGVVWYTLEKQEVTRHDVAMFLGMYLSYVTIIFCSDMYHRKVTLERLRKQGQERKKVLKESLRRRLSLIPERNGEGNETLIKDESTPLIENVHNSYGEETFERLKRSGGQSTKCEINNGIEDPEIPGATTLESSSSGNQHSTTSSGVPIPRRPRLSIPDRFAMLMSNYDPASVKFDRFDLSSIMTSSSDDGSDDGRHNATSEWKEITNVLHEAQPGIHKSQENVLAGGGEKATMYPQSLESVPEQQEKESSLHGEETEDEVVVRAWSLDLFVDAYEELVYRFHRFLRNSFQADISLVERIGLFFELPFVAARTVTVPVPCEEHYCRPILALSIAISPYWIMYYTDARATSASSYCFVSFIIALSIVRYAGEDKLPLVASVPISLYGFFIAATW